MNKWNAIYAAGCQWCGFKCSGLTASNADGYTAYGLQWAHIFANGNAPNHEWNGFVLCPNCHGIFDKIVKPKILHAIEIGMRGFSTTSGKGAKSYCVAQSLEECLVKLVSDTEVKSARHEIPLESTLPTWLEKNCPLPEANSKDAQG